MMKPQTHVIQEEQRFDDLAPDFLQKIDQVTGCVYSLSREFLFRGMTMTALSAEAALIEYRFVFPSYGHYVHRSGNTMTQAQIDRFRQDWMQYLDRLTPAANPRT